MVFLPELWALSHRAAGFFGLGFRVCAPWFCNFRGLGGWGGGSWFSGLGFRVWGFGGLGFRVRISRGQTPEVRTKRITW